MLGKRFGAMLLIGAMLVIPTFAEAQQRETGGEHGGAPVGVAAHAGHAGPVAVSRPGGGHIAAQVGEIARGGHFAADQGNWSAHPAWRGAGAFSKWRGGHWWQGAYEGRYGAWWIVGPDWYWYPTEVAVIPNPMTPPGMTLGFW